MILLPLLLACAEPAPPPPASAEDSQPATDVDSADTVDTVDTIDTTDTTDTIDTVDTDADDRRGLVEHGLVTCAEPAAREETPYDRVELGEAWESQLPPGWSGSFERGRGLLVADLTGDGRLDVLLADRTRPQLFIAQEDGAVLLESDRLPIPEDLADVENWRTTLASAADVDGDRDLDLVLGFDRGRDRLLLNDGAGHFVDATDGSGFPEVLTNLRTAPWGDLDGDGDLDLFLGVEALEARQPDPGDPSVLLLNNGAGRFSDISDRLETSALHGYTQVAGILDLDVDGDQDLYIINHHRTYTGNHLLLNDGGARFSAAASAGLDIAIEGMGLGVGDLNEDGVPDLLISDLGALHLMESADNGSWVQTALSRALLPDVTISQLTAWGNELVDMDNDGDLDAVALFGPTMNEDTGPGNPGEQPDGLWLQQEDGAFEASAERWGLAQERNGRGLAVIDWNGDGWLDLFKTGVDLKTRLYLARCGEESWLAVDLQGASPNTHAVGARVEVEADGRLQTRWVLAASTSLYTSTVQPTHFGLGEVERVDRLTIHWPDGSVSSWSDLNTRQRVTAVQAEAPEGQ